MKSWAIVEEREKKSWKGKEKESKCGRKYFTHEWRTLLHFKYLARDGFDAFYSVSTNNIHKYTTTYTHTHYVRSLFSMQFPFIRNSVRKNINND